jgi:hypothetical protein
MTSPRPTSRPLAAAAVRTQVRQEAPKLAVAGGAGVAEVVVSLLEPWPLASAVDGALAPGATPSWMVGHDPVALLASAALGTVCLAVLGGALDAVASGTAEFAAERVGSALRATALDRVLALSLRSHDRNPSDEILARLTSDVGRVLDALVATVTTLVPDLLLFTGIFVVLLAVDAPLAAVGLAVVPLLAWLSRRQRQRVRAAERPIGQVLRRGERFGTDGFTAPEATEAPGGPVSSAMDVYGIGATTLAVLDPDADGPFLEILREMVDADPDSRPTVEEALAALVRSTGRGARTLPRRDRRPVPRARRHDVLTRDGGK